MWQCEKCNRIFEKNNQSHICVVKDVGELFSDKQDEMVLAWDTLTQKVMTWRPNVYSASTKSIVYTSKKAWLIIKPMKSDLDVKFYHDQKIISGRIRKYQQYPNKFAHHIRVQNECQVDHELIDLLRKGYEYSLQ